MSRLELLQTLHLAIEAARFVTLNWSTVWNISPGLVALIISQYEAHHRLPTAVVFSWRRSVQATQNRRSSAASSTVAAAMSHMV